jgi:hypothetical protein
VPRRLWQHLLHNQHALLIKGSVAFQAKCRGDECSLPSRTCLGACNRQGRQAGQSEVG